MVFSKVKVGLIPITNLPKNRVLNYIRYEDTEFNIHISVLYGKSLEEKYILFFRDLIKGLRQRKADTFRSLLALFLDNERNKSLEASGNALLFSALEKASPREHNKLMKLYILK